MKRYFLLTALIAGLFVSHNAHGMLVTWYAITKTSNYLNETISNKLSNSLELSSDQNNDKMCFSARKIYSEAKNGTANDFISVYFKYNDDIKSIEKILNQIEPHNLKIEENIIFYNWFKKNLHSTIQDDNFRVIEAIREYNVLEKNLEESIKDAKEFLIGINANNLKAEIPKNFYNWFQSQYFYTLMPHDNSSGWQGNDNYRYKIDKNKTGLI